MAISVVLNVTPAAPAHGQTVTAQYVVTGNNAIPPASATLTGDVNVGGTDYPVSASLTMPGTPALPQTFATPVCPGLSFSPTADPATFTAVVP